MESGAWSNLQWSHVESLHLFQRELDQTLPGAQWTQSSINYENFGMTVIEEQSEHLIQTAIIFATFSSFQLFIITLILLKYL